MQGVFTIVLKRIREEFFASGSDRYSTMAGAHEANLIIGDASFAAMLKEIDAFSEQLRARRNAGDVRPTRTE